MVLRCSRGTITLLALVLAALAAREAQGGGSYDAGWSYDDWKIQGPANTTYELQAHHYRCGWSNLVNGWGTILGGTTDSSGKDSDYAVRVGNGVGMQPYHTAVRAVFSDGTKQELELTGRFTRNSNVRMDPLRFHAGVPGVSGPLLTEIRQNVQEPMDRVGLASWLLDGSWVSLTLPDHFEFVVPGNVEPIVPGDLVFGPAFLEDEGRTMSVQVLFNGRIEPLNGLIIHGSVIAYDGVGIPFEYPVKLAGEADITLAPDPAAVIETGPIHSGATCAVVLTDPVLEWFDAASGFGYPTFAMLEAAHDAWVGETDALFDLEDLPVGEKLGDQYRLERAMWFTGAQGGARDHLTGIAVEGDPALTEDLTGYDGTYQPDGSQVYVRFQNTIENPDAPFTIELARPQRMVAAFIGCGVQGSDHSFTITVSDGSGLTLQEHVVEAQLWESDPTGQNYETLIAVRSPQPNIRTVSIRNNALTEFADALTIDTIETFSEPSVRPGDVNFDGRVDFTDLVQLLAAWGPCDVECHTDFDVSGTTDFLDLVTLLANWDP